MPTPKPHPRPHPLFGAISLKRDAWHTAVRRHAEDWSLQDALDGLPGGAFYQAQYDAFIAQWPTRRLFLEQHGTTAQLNREQALYDHLIAR